MSKRQNKLKGEEGGRRKKELDKLGVGGVESSVGLFLESSLDVFGEAGALDARILYPSRLRVISLGGATLVHALVHQEASGY